MRNRLICGNWKMYKTVDEAVTFIRNLAPLVSHSQALVYLAVPYTVIYPAAEAAQGTNIVIGAQNMNDASEGAFTGEVSGKMLKDAGARFVLLGHSERRIYFHETNAFINNKLRRAIKEGLQPILCIGESFAEREEGRTDQVLSTQLEECLAGIRVEELTNLVLAYEPVWAIGTGKTATPQIAESEHAFCRDWLMHHFNEEFSSRVPILYGGSVKIENIGPLMEEPDIDGALVGGSSLVPEILAQIINFNSTHV